MNSRIPTGFGCAIVALLMWLPSTVAADELLLIGDGQAHVQVFAPGEAQWAGRRLADRLQRWTGVAPPVQVTGQEPEGDGDLIIIGTPETTPLIKTLTQNGAQLTELGEEGYLLRVEQWQGRRVLLAAGATMAGANNAVSELVTWELRIHKKRAVVPAELNESASPALKYRILWSWDGQHNWSDSVARMHEIQPSINGNQLVPYNKDAFLDHFKTAVDFASDHQLNGYIIYGFVRDEHGGVEASQELTRYAKRNNVRILPGVCTENAYGGFSFSRQSEYNLDARIEQHPELAFIHPRTNQPEPGICPAKAENIAWLREGTRWFLETFPDIGGVNLENGDWMCCATEDCQAERAKPGNDPNFFWDQMITYKPVIEEIERLRPDLWITFATYVGFSEQQLRQAMKQAIDAKAGSAVVYPPHMFTQMPSAGVAQWTFSGMARPEAWPKGLRPPATNWSEHIGLLHQGSVWGAPVDPARWWAEPMSRLDDVSELLQFICDRIQSSGMQGLVLKGQTGAVSPANELNYIAMAYFTWYPDHTYEQFLKDRLALCYGGEDLATLFLELLRNTTTDPAVIEQDRLRARQILETERLEDPRQQARWRNLADELDRRLRVLINRTEAEGAAEQENTIPPPPPNI